MFCTNTVFTLGQRAGNLLKWKVPWKVLQSLTAQRQEHLQFVLLYVYVQILPLLAWENCTKMGDTRTASGTEETYPLGDGYWEMCKNGKKSPGEICRSVPGCDYVCAGFQLVTLKLSHDGCIASEV